MLVLRYIVFFWVLLLSSAYALKIKLNNGLLYEGEVISENSVSYTIKTEEKTITILKRMIVETDKTPISNPSNSATSSQPINGSTEDPAIDYKGKMLSVTLKNGMVFQGIMISDNGKIVVINRDGSPVNIYRSTIARIDIIGAPIPVRSGTQISDSLPAVAKSFVNDSKLPEQKKSTVSIMQLDEDEAPVKTIDSSGGSEKLKVDAPPRQDVSTNVPKIAQSSPEKSKLSVDKEKNPHVQTILKASDIDKIKEKIPDNVPADTAAVVVAFVSIPGKDHSTDNIYIPPARARIDGKKEIVLKNGTVFLGRILSENDRFISFDSDGTSMNVLKKLIKEIDGVAYRDDADQLKKVQVKVKKDTVQSVDVQQLSFKRKLPPTVIPAGMTTEQLLDSLRSPVWETRSKACRMLGTMGQWAYSAVSNLTALLADTAQMKINIPVWIDTVDQQKLLAPAPEAARALAYLGEKGFQALADALNSPDVLVRKSAVFGLLEFSDDISKTGVLSSVVKDKDPSVRALALGTYCNPQGEDHLIMALADNETLVRSNATLLLGKIKSERAIPQLQMLLDDNRYIVRANAIEALGAIGHSNVSEKMLSLLNDQNFIVREKAVSALGRLHDTIAIWPMINVLRDVNPDVRAAAATALSYIRDPRAIPSLYALLKDESPLVRERARESLRYHTELTQLIDALTDANDTVRENASYVLWLLTGKDFGNDKEKWIVWYKQEQERKR